MTQIQSVFWDPTRDKHSSWNHWDRGIIPQYKNVVIHVVNDDWNENFHLQVTVTVPSQRSMECLLRVRGEFLLQVEGFKYLGNLVTVRKGGKGRLLNELAQPLQFCRCILVCHGEVRTECESEGVDLHAFPHQCPGAVGSDQKNENTDT